MPTQGILIALSEKRLALLSEDPEMLEDIVEEGDAIPGLLEIGTAWDALDVLVSDRGKDAVLGDAVLARTGKQLHAESNFEAVRLIGPTRVVEVLRKLESLPPTVVREGYAQLAAKKVHGKIGSDEGEIEALEILLKQVVALYRDAAKAKQSILTILV